MVRHNDVVLGLCGKHVWWPARVHLHGGAAPSSDGISVVFFGDHKSAWLPHRKLRSFGELDALTHRERGRTPLYAKAIDEAREWASSHTSASTSEDDDDGADNWACNGEIVPARLLPKSASPRVPEISSLPRPVWRLAQRTPAEAAEEASAAGDDDDGTADSDYELRHAPFESLEKRGFFAHPEIASIIYGADAAAGAADGGKVSRTGGGGGGGGGLAEGSVLHVPATIFGDTREYLVYEGVVQRVRRKNQHDGGEVEVYFKIDGQTFWFATALAESWMPDAAPARKRPRKRGGGERRRKGAATTADEEAAIADAFANACGDGGAAAAASSQVVTEAEGVKLILSDRNSTGYHNVRPERSRYRTYNYEDGKQRHIGTFDTAVEAALAYARHVGSLRAPAQPPPPVEAEAPPRPVRPIFYLQPPAEEEATAAPAPCFACAGRHRAHTCGLQLARAVSSNPRPPLPVRAPPAIVAAVRAVPAAQAGSVVSVKAAAAAVDCGKCLNCLDKPRFGGPGLKRKRCSAPIEGNEAGAEAGEEAAEVVRLHLEGQPTLCVGW